MKQMSSPNAKTGTLFKKASGSWGKKISKKLIISIILLIISAVFLLQKPDIYTVSSNARHNAYVAEAYAEGITPLDSLEIRKGSVAGCAFIMPITYLDRGDYKVSIRYSSDSDSNYAEIFSEQVTNSYNQLGTVFWKDNLSSTNGETVTLDLDWYLEEGVYSSVFRVYYEQGDFTIHEITVQSKGAAFQDNLFLGIAAAMCGIFLLISYIRKPEKDCSFTSILLWLTAALATLPCMTSGLIIGHDLPFHLARIAGMNQGILTGQVPLFINTVQLSGFGYLSGAMYPQMFLYIPAVMRLLGVSMMTSYEFFLFVINAATVYIAYKSIAGICRSEKIGAVAAILYTMAPYRLLDMYTRSSLGELLGLVFIPLVIYGTYEVLWGNHKKWPLLVMGMTGIMQSHVISVELAAIMMGLEGLIWLVTLRKGKRYLQGILGMIKAAAATVMINLFFLVPFLYYSRTPMEAVVMKIPMHLHSVYFSQMLTPKVWAGGGSELLGLEKEEMSFGLGIILIIGFLAMVLWIAVRKLRKEKLDTVDHIGLHCIIIAAFTCFLSSNLFPWDTIQRISLLNKLLSPIQFIWRFLGITSILLSVAAAVAFVKWGQKLKKEMWVYQAAALLVLITTWQFYDSIPREMELISADNKMLINGTDTTDTLYLYAPVSPDEFNRSQVYLKVTGASVLEVSDFQKEGSTVAADILIKEYDRESYLIFPIYYYPGYEVSWNGQVLPKDHIASVNGKAAIALPAEGGHVEIRYRGHWSFPIAFGVSVFSILGMCAVIILKRNKKPPLADEQKN